MYQIESGSKLVLRLEEEHSFAHCGSAACVGGSAAVVGSSSEGSTTLVTCMLFPNVKALSIQRQTGIMATVVAEEGITSKNCSLSTRQIA